MGWIIREDVRVDLIWTKRSSGGFDLRSPSHTVISSSIRTSNQDRDFRARSSSDGSNQFSTVLGDTLQFPCRESDVES